MTISADNNPQIYSPLKNRYVENRTIQTGGRNIIDKNSNNYDLRYNLINYFKADFDSKNDVEEKNRMYNSGKLHNSMKLAYENAQYLGNEGKIERIKSVFNIISSKLITLPFEKCSVEITSDNFLKISLSFTNERMLILSKDFESEKLLGSENILYSFFINRTLISADDISLNLFSENFKKYINS